MFCVVFVETLFKVMYLILYGDRYIFVSLFSWITIFVIIMYLGFIYFVIKQILIFHSYLNIMKIKNINFLVFKETLKKVR